MRRIRLQPVRTGVGGNTIGITLPRPPSAPPVRDPLPCTGGDCTPSIDGLFWDDDNSGLSFLPIEGGESATNDEGQTDIEISIVDGSPVISDFVELRIAWLRGTTCGCQTIWDVTFADGDLAGEEYPYVYVVGNVLIVQYREDSVGYGDGVLTAYATCGDTQYGPITLTQIHSYS